MTTLTERRINWVTMAIFFLRGREATTGNTRKYVCCSQANITLPAIGGFHAISGDTNNNGEMNKCWRTNKPS